MTTGKFDAEAFFAALDAERRSRGVTWKKIAEQAKVPASTLTRMSQGRRPDVDSLAALCSWSGLSADSFTRTESSRNQKASSLAQITSLLRADESLTREGMQAIEAIIKTAYEQMRQKQ